MGRTLTKEEILDLPTGERLRLIESLWESLSPEDVEVPPSHREALDEAITDRHVRPDAERPWDAAKKDLLRRK